MPGRVPRGTRPGTAATRQPGTGPGPPRYVRLVTADGQNLDACADGTCEVFVATGDSLPNVSGAGPARITVEGGMVAIAHGDPGGMSSSLSGYPGMPQQINNQVFLIVAVQGGQGLLRLSLV